MTSDDSAGPNDLTIAFLRHPLLAALGSACLTFGLLLGMIRVGLIASAVAAGFIFCFQWICWRHGGWARRREERIHGRDQMP